MRLLLTWTGRVVIVVKGRSEADSSYEAVPLAVGRAESRGRTGRGLLRRRSLRPARRGVMYVHGTGDAFVADDIVAWYTGRGFHFYAVDLRSVGTARDPCDTRAAIADLAECLRSLDEAAGHLRLAEGIETVVVAAHGTGALVAALWCHARRGEQPADAVILAAPLLGARPSLRERAAGLAGRRCHGSPLVAGAQRRLRRGLDIGCPVLVVAGAGARRRRGCARLGEHMTWLMLDGCLPGQPAPAADGHRQFLDQLGRWLSAYVSGQIRDQLL